MPSDESEPSTKEITRRKIIGMVGGGALSAAGYFTGRWTARGEHQTQEQLAVMDRRSRMAAAHEESTARVGCWQAKSIPYAEVMEEVGIATEDEKQEDGTIPDEYFDVVEPSEDTVFVLLYGEAYRTDSGDCTERQSDSDEETAPASMWALDVWIPQGQSAPLSLEYGDIKQYRLPEGVGEDRTLPAYPHNLHGGGFLCFEVGTPRNTALTIELLFDPDYEEASLEAVKSGARWKYTIEQELIP